jgi:hypothetical protein
MPSDKAPKIETARPPQWRLPEISSVRIRAASYEPRATRSFTNPLSPAKDAVEILVTLKAPLPVRAMGPMLCVGRVCLTESEALDKEGTELRFWAFDRSVLEDGAPIVMLWMGEQPLKRPKAKFTYKLPRK